MRERRPRAPPLRPSDAGGRGQGRLRCSSPLLPVRAWGGEEGGPATRAKENRFAFASTLGRVCFTLFFFSDQTMNRFAFQLRELVLCIFLMFTVFTASVVSQAVASGGAFFCCDIEPGGMNARCEFLAPLTLSLLSLLSHTTHSQLHRRHR